MASRRFNAARRLQLQVLGEMSDGADFWLNGRSLNKQANKQKIYGGNKLKTLWCAHQPLSPGAAHLDVYTAQRSNMKVLIIRG